MLDDLFKDLKSSLKRKKEVHLTGNLDLSIPDIINVATRDAKVSFDLSKKQKEKLEKIHKVMIDQLESGMPIYGVNTGYGGRVEVVLNKGSKKERFELAKKISGSILHVDVSTGPPIKKEIVRAAILIRINSLLAGHSAVRYEVLEIVSKLLNKDITPVVGQYGSLGASGDLALNGRVLSVLMHQEGVKVWDSKGKELEAKNLLKKHNIGPVELLPKEGLALVNGDSFSTASALLVTYEVALLMLINTVVASITIQALKGSMRSFHPILSGLRQHPGQKLEAEMLVNLLKGSKLAYQDLEEPLLGELGAPVQDVYSIRCLPQYYGPDWENLSQTWKSLELNINSASDNPLWTTPEHTSKKEKPHQWVSGGNFLSMHMVDVLDKVRKIATHIVKQNDRHLARLVHPEFNKGLPANLSDEKAISQTVFKGLQTQMGMYEVYSTFLSSPISTLFGTHEEFNQDLTSHAFTSGIVAEELLQITRYAIATNLISSCQAIDLRGGPELLSDATRPFYEWTREKVPYVKKEQPMGFYIEKVSESILRDQFLSIVFDTLYLNG